MLIQQILRLSQRGIGATSNVVQDLANDLLAERNRGTVGKHWKDNFRKCTPEIKLQTSRSYDLQPAFNKDLNFITPWSKPVINGKKKYSISYRQKYLQLRWDRLYIRGNQRLDSLYSVLTR
jgi:hypothetical protein